MKLIELFEIDEAILPRRSRRFGVGKEIGGNVYLHKDYERLLPQDVIEKAKSLIKDFPYTIIKFNSKSNAVSFIQSVNFDAVAEPTVGRSVVVKADGSIRKIKPSIDPWIYHHKWLFVDDDYQGFDVEESKERSRKWLHLQHVDKSRIGKKSFWDRNVLPSLVENEINVRWAVGTNSNKASRTARTDMEDPYYTVVWLPVEEVMKRTLSFQRLDVNDPAGGENAIGNRIAMAKEHWRSGGFMDPSLLSLDENSGYKVIVFSDGRHRMIAAHQLSERWAPAIVPKEHISQLKELMEVRKNSSLLEVVLPPRSVIHKTWHNVSLGKIIEIENEHWEEIDDHPEKFGLPSDYDTAHFEVVANLVEQGWIRASYEYVGFASDGNKTMFAEGMDLKELRQVIRYYIQKFPEIEKIIIEHPEGTNQLEGNQIDQFARTGRIQRDRVGVGRIQRDRVGVGITESTKESLYGAWYDANTDILYKLSSSSANVTSGLSPHEDWLIKNLEIFGETKESLESEDFEYIYQSSKDYGLVRIVYPGINSRWRSKTPEYDIEGDLKPVKRYLKKYYREIIQRIKAQEIDLLLVEFSDDDVHMFQFDSYDELENTAALREFNRFVRT